MLNSKSVIHVRDLPCPVSLYWCSVMNFESINKGGKWYLKYINQDSKSVKCIDTKQKCQSILKSIVAMGKLIRSRHVVWTIYLISFPFLHSPSSFWEGGKKKPNSKKMKMHWIWVIEVQNNKECSDWCVSGYVDKYQDMYDDVYCPLTVRLQFQFSDFSCSWHSSWAVVCVWAFSSPS